MGIERYQAFLNTTYCVLQSPLFDIKINEISTTHSNLERLTFITAWIPVPHSLSLDENQKRKLSPITISN
jgi:hypothetical protein